MQRDLFASTSCMKAWGADAASQAIDAIKLDINKFTSLGPGFVKGDRLVVKFGG